MPVAVVKEAQAELAKIMRDVDEVAITVLLDDEAAVRFAVHLGFHDREDIRLSRKAELVAAILADPKMKIPAGDQFVSGSRLPPKQHVGSLEMCPGTLAIIGLAAG